MQLDAPTYLAAPPEAARADDPIVAGVASHAAAEPGQLAVSDGAVRLSYADLDRRSNRLARHLREAGAGPEVCVGLLFDRSADFVVAALAVLKAGAAYLPLDASTPAERNASILDDAGATVLLSHRGKARGFVGGGRAVVELDGPDAARIASRPDTPVAQTAGPDALAYVIYTSGSTGRPKGVEVTRSNLGNLIGWHRAAFRVTPADRASQVAGLAFDAAGVWEVWPHLAAGASVHLADDRTRRSPQALRDWLVAERITIAFVPTLLAEQLLQLSLARGDRPANPPHRARWTPCTAALAAEGSPFALINNYGPTECTVVATSGAVPPDVKPEGPPSIGRPIANTSAFVLDGSSCGPSPPARPASFGLRRAGVGRGYREQTPGGALTAEPVRPLAVRAAP